MNNPKFVVEVSQGQRRIVCDACARKELTEGEAGESFPFCEQCGALPHWEGRWKLTRASGDEFYIHRDHAMDYGKLAYENGDNSVRVSRVYRPDWPAFRNYTPHDVVLILGDREIVIPSQGVARVAEVVLSSAPYSGVNISRIGYGEVEGLPEYQPDIKTIVSRTVAERCDRGDLVFPYRLVRDAAGNIRGCEAFARI